MAIGSVAELVVFVKGNIGEFQGKMGEVRSTIEAESGRMSKMSAVAGKVLLGAAVAAGGAAVYAIDIATKEQAAQAQLANALKNTGTSYEAQRGAIEKNISTGEKYGETSEETQRALAKGVTALGSMTKAHKALEMAEDFSAVTGKSMTASMLLAIKAMEGNTGALKRAGVDLPIVTSNALGSAKAYGSLLAANAKVDDAQAHLNATMEKYGPQSKQAIAAYGKMMAAQGEQAAATDNLNTKTEAGTKIAKAWEEKFGGSAAAASKTFQGQLKATKAEVEDFAAKIGTHLLPIVQMLMGKFMEATSYILHHKDALIALAAVIGGVLTTAFAIWSVNTVKHIADVVSQFAKDVSAGAKWMGEHGKQAMEVAKNFASMAKSGALWVAEHAKQVATAVADFATEAAAAIASAASTAAAWAVAAAPFVLIGLAIAAVVAAIIWLWVNWQKVWNFIKDNPAIAIVVSILAAPIAAMVAIVLAAHWLYDNWSKIWATIKQVVSGFISFFKPAIDGIANVIKAVVAIISDVIHGNWSKLWGDMLNLASAGFDAVVAFFVTMPGKILGAVMSLIGLLLPIGLQMLLGLLNGILAGAEAVWGWLTALPGVILGLVAAAATWLLQTGIDTLTGLLNGMISGVGAVLSFVGNLPSTIGDAMLGLISDFFNIGVQVMQGLWNGLKSLADTVKNWVSNIASDIGDAFASAVGLGSPSRLFHSHGSYIMQGLLLGLKSQGPAVLNYMTGFAKQVSNAAQVSGQMSLRSTASGLMSAGGPARTAAAGSSTDNHTWYFITAKDLDEAMKDAPLQVRVQAKAFLTTGSTR